MPSRWLRKMEAPTASSRAAAWAVHLFSASGAVLALLAVLAIQGHRWTEAMLWLFAALVVDGIDGTMARAARVKDLASRVDGAVLDLVIDYLNYVFVPTLFILEAGLLPDAAALPLAALIQLSSLYVFARRDMKTDDNYFRGFPALWNIVALYLFAAGLDPGIAAVVVAALVVLTFVPIHFVHPFRVRDYGAFLPVLALIWSFSTLALLIDTPAAALPLAALIQLSSLYVFARRDMKTEDNYFRGFPALWNIVALYLFAAGLDPVMAAAVVAALVVLTFAPIHFVHPFRVRDYGVFLPVLALIWSFSTLALLIDTPAAARGILLPLSAISAFVIVGLGLWRTARGPKAQKASSSSAVSDSTSATVRSSESETR